MKMPWILDPVTKQLSVSLTIMLVFGLGALVTNILVAFGKASSTAGINELFYSSVALYFGRRNINIGGKQYSAGDAEQILNKVT